MGKRGLSSVVTSLIIILLVLVAIGVIWVVVNGLIEDSAENIELTQFTINLKILSVQNDSDSLDVKVKRNVGSGDLVGIKFFFSDNSGTKTIENYTALKEIEEKIFVFVSSDMGGILPNNTKTVSIAPIIKTESGENRVGDIVDSWYRTNVGTFVRNTRFSGGSGGGSNGGGDNNCVPQCSGKECGANGCGGVCGSCSTGETCTNYQCVPESTIPVNDFCDGNGLCWQIRSPIVVSEINPGGCISWVNVTNASKSDNIFATIGPTNQPSMPSCYMVATKFNFSLPESASLRYYKINIEKNALESPSFEDVYIVTNNEVSLMKVDTNPVPQLWGYEQDSFNTWSVDSIPVMPLNILTISNINSQGFGFAFSFPLYSSQGSNFPLNTYSLYVDSMNMTLYYYDASTVIEHCDNGVKDSDETDVDCGGSVCGECGEGDLCHSSVDCQEGGQCKTIDGSDKPCDLINNNWLTNTCACIGVYECVQDSDCVSGTCFNNQCVVGCGNGVCDSSEDMMSCPQDCNSPA